MRQNVGPGRSACTRDVICLALPAVHFNPSFLITTAAVAAVVLSLNAHSMHFFAWNFGRIYDGNTPDHGECHPKKRFRADLYCHIRVNRLCSVHITMRVTGREGRVKPDMCKEGRSDTQSFRTITISRFSYLAKRCLLQ